MAVNRDVGSGYEGGGGGGGKEGGVQVQVKCAAEATTRFVQ